MKWYICVEMSMGSWICDCDTQRRGLGLDRDSGIIHVCVGVETMRVGEASYGELCSQKGNSARMEP